MTRSRRTILRLLAGLGLVALAGAVLVFKVPSFKQQAKARWHIWKCPELPKERSARSVEPDGRAQYADPFPYCSPATDNPASLLFDMESCKLSTFFSGTRDAYSGEGVLTGHWLISALQRRAGDVGEQLISISAGCMMKSAQPEPDVRIVIRIDHPDGTLLEWNEKRLITGEHVPNTWEPFNFEWLLRDLHVGPDDVISIFIDTDNREELMIDDMRIVFRSANIPAKSAGHA